MIITILMNVTACLHNSGYPADMDSGYSMHSHRHSLQVVCFRAVLYSARTRVHVPHAFHVYSAGSCRLVYVCVCMCEYMYVCVYVCVHGLCE
ncbi:hypothetical protein FKM82_025046 [Ascaphus truei]